MAQYPAVWAPPIPEAITPQPWLNALNAAEQAGQIPDIPVATLSGPNLNPTYGGQDPGGTGPAICSSSAGCRGPGDQWDAPVGHIGIGFDDGPSEVLVFSFLMLWSSCVSLGISYVVRFPSNEKSNSHTLHDRHQHT